MNTTPHLHTPAHVNFLAWLKEEPKLKITIVSRQKVTLHISRAVTVVSLFVVTCTFHSFSSSSSTFFERRRHERLLGPLADQNTLASYESTDLIEVNGTEVTPILFHRPSMTSTFDTPPLDADLDDEQIKAMLASPLYQQEREKQVQTNH